MLLSTGTPSRCMRTGSTPPPVRWLRATMVEASCTRWRACCSRSCASLGVLAVTPAASSWSSSARLWFGSSERL
jgi:hypothetical protein